MMRNKCEWYDIGMQNRRVSCYSYLYMRIDNVKIFKKGIAFDDERKLLCYGMHMCRQVSGERIFFC